MADQLLLYTGILSSISLAALMTATKLLSGFRFWPPGEKNAKWVIYWILSSLNLVGVVGLFLFQIKLQNILSVPVLIGAILTVTGVIVTLYAIRNLGLEETSGKKGEFSAQGLYNYSRNPQVLGNIASLVGLVLVVQTLDMVILSFLTSSWLIAMIFAEEEWLEEAYGEDYSEYRREVSRFV